MYINPINNTAFGRLAAPRYLLDLGFYTGVPLVPEISEVDDKELPLENEEEAEKPEETEQEGEFDLNGLMSYFDVENIRKNAMNIKDISTDEALLDALLEKTDEASKNQARPSYEQVAAAYKSGQVSGKKIDVRA